ncbi:DMT family transporter [Streptomyces jeddahensis]|uniref:Putative DMT superfamily transporter inner membrane protein n=1 Tax=Streptomyces jeddahensis TaxID=1716141 RepID=A0A177HWP8_9ACTN|nr:EamA family transporter [Streptomyces jeddahensis]OAH14987.1 putative DMT superfamily transporter inner membrane protein [Streptomyces jeddahensis]
MPNRTTPLTPARPAAVGVRPSRAGLLSGPAPILTSAVLWGTTGTAGSLAPAGAPAAAIGCAGLALGGILLFLTSRGARCLPAACTGRERWLLVVGALAVAGYPVTFYPAVARTGVAVATVIALGSAPVFAGLLSWITGQARPTTRWAGATTAAVLGCVLLVLGPELTEHATPMDPTGVVLAACAGLSYAAYSMIGGRLITNGHPSSAVMGVLFGAAGLLVLPLVMFVDMHWLTTTRGAVVAVYLALFTVYLAYRLFGHGLRRTPASVATSLTLAEPAVAAVLGVTVLGERLPPASWCGMAVLGLGLVLLTSPDRRRR